MATRPPQKITYTQQELMNMSFDTDTNTFLVSQVGYDGQNIQRMNASNLRVAYYTDGTTYDYYCFAAPGTSLSASLWLVKRVDGNGQVDYPSGSANFNQPATNLSTVQGYTYS